MQVIEVEFFYSLNKGRVVISTVLVRRALTKGVKLSGPSIYLSGAMVKGVSSSYDRCAMFLEVNTFSISSGLSMCRH